MTQVQRVKCTLLSILISIQIALLSTNQDRICGRPSGTEYLLENDRIVAGYDVGYYRYPWYAALLRYGRLVCGAALIGPRTIVTAAHCYKEFLDLSNQGSVKLEDIYTVKLGIYNICLTEKTQTEYKVQKVHVHDLYSAKQPYYDVCLLTLANDTSGFEPICLPDTYVRKKPKEATVPGLGTLKYHGALPCTVHEARILIYSDEECRLMVNRTGNNATAIAKAFCAGYLQGGIDTCQGDSGGPLQVINENGDYVLLGVVSFGFHCAMPGLLGMYTDISQFVDWIREKSDTIVYHKNKTISTTEVPVNINRPAKKKPPKRPNYWRPIRVIIMRKKKLYVIKKSVLHRPINTDE